MALPLRLAATLLAQNLEMEIGRENKSIRKNKGRMTMTVKAVLGAKGAEVFTIEPGATVQNAISALAEHAISARRPRS